MPRLSAIFSVPYACVGRSVFSAFSVSAGEDRLEVGQLETARQYLLEGLQTVRALGVQRQIIAGLTALGYVALRLGDFAGALRHLNEGLEMAREGGRPRNICDVQLTRANTYLALNDLSAARSALHESMTIARSLNAHPQKVRALGSVVAYYQWLGQHEEAASLAGVINDESLVDEALFKPVCAQLEAALGGDRYREALAQGKARSLDDAISEVQAFLR